VRGGQDTSQSATVLHRFTQSGSSHDDLPLMHMKTGATHFVNAAVACDELAMDCSCKEQQLHGVVFSGHVMRNPCSVTPLQIVKPCQTGRESGFELNALFRCIVTLSGQTSRGLARPRLCNRDYVLQYLLPRYTGRSKVTVCALPTSHIHMTLCT
jgi:hypothetical protein